MMHCLNFFINYTIFIEAAAIVTEVVNISCCAISSWFYNELWTIESNNKLLVLVQKLEA